MNVAPRLLTYATYSAVAQDYHNTTIRTFADSYRVINSLQETRYYAKETVKSMAEHLVNVMIELEVDPQKELLNGRNGSHHTPGTVNMEGNDGAKEEKGEEDAGRAGYNEVGEAAEDGEEGNRVERQEDLILSSNESIQKELPEKDINGEEEGDSNVVGGREEVAPKAQSSESADTEIQNGYAHVGDSGEYNEVEDHNPKHHSEPTSVVGTNERQQRPSLGSVIEEDVSEDASDGAIADGELDGDEGEEAYDDILADPRSHPIPSNDRDSPGATQMRQRTSEVA